MSQSDRPDNDVAIRCCCNQCETEWLLKHVDITKAKVSNIEGLGLEFFTCPGCGRLYVCGLVDFEVTSLRATIKQISDELNDPERHFGSEHELELRDKLVESQEALKMCVEKLFSTYSPDSFTLTRNKEIFYTA